MDTEITYTYTDGFHKDPFTFVLRLDQDVYKTYCRSRDVNVEDSLSLLPRRLWYCHLRATGHEHCLEFLKDIMDVCPDPELQKLLLFLRGMCLREVIFQCC